MTLEFLTGKCKEISRDFIVLFVPGIREGKEKSKESHVSILKKYQDLKCWSKEKVLENESRTIAHLVTCIVGKAV